jgi:hypothetical protein
MQQVHWRNLIQPKIVQGALGNMIRNSNILVPDLLREGVLEELLNAAQYAPLAVAKTALFSLGNFCLNKECKTRLLELGLQEILKGYISHQDPQIQKYYIRIQKCLQ